jgi:hypothetical protein
VSLGGKEKLHVDLTDRLLDETGRPAARSRVCNGRPGDAAGTQVRGKKYLQKGKSRPGIEVSCQSADMLSSGRGAIGAVGSMLASAGHGPQVKDRISHDEEIEVLVVEGDKLRAVPQASSGGSAAYSGGQGSIAPQPPTPGIGGLLTSVKPLPQKPSVSFKGTPPTVPTSQNGASFKVVDALKSKAATRQRAIVDVNQMKRRLAEVESEKKALGRVIDPRKSKYLSYWDITTASCLGFTAISTPYEVSFVVGSPIG